jgi:hypothetical protein
MMDRVVYATGGRVNSSSNDCGRVSTEEDWLEKRSYEDDKVVPAIHKLVRQAALNSEKRETESGGGDTKNSRTRTLLGQ